MLLAAGGMFFEPTLFAVVWTVGFSESPIVPGWLTLALLGRRLLPARA
ncbi:hypothetical protein SHIRM173S_09514 [Streptomyces hirsutus]